MKIHWLHRITWLYLTLPFIIFCLGWLRLTIAIPITVVIIFTLWRLLKLDPSIENKLPVNQVFYMLMITGLWVFLSGVGGYTFQNWDHNWRNAVLRDLISYDWPVFYSTPEKGPITMLVYYVGYWLPAALAGKLLGWQFANFILFLWTWLGVLLVTLHISLKLKVSAIKISLLLILFSGMDEVGTLLFAKEYPTLWPPITHLEIWSGSLQYSSLTTQLFWVFNQAIPAWLCCALILESNSLLFEQQRQSSRSFSRKILLWSLCFFFAPLASIGLFPYLVIAWFKQADFKSPFKNLRIDLLLSSGIIFLISYLFFSSNSAAGQRGLQSIPFTDFLAFFLLEGGILWLLLAPFKWRDISWITTGVLLLTLPFIQIGNGRDFVMRASIAPLFYVMVMTGEIIFQNNTSRFYRFAIAVILVLGALTPLYEINRSIYRTYDYYFALDKTQRVPPPSQPVVHLEQPGIPEKEHPGSLTANGIPTLKFMTDELSKNFIANVRQSLYYRFLSAR
ncbi:MAG: hypothetical protein JNM55_19690 [Anaerolineales bacterium]|nr:hypothetical protein [Anaerolineales bacterium]